MRLVHSEAPYGYRRSRPGKALQLALMGLFCGVWRRLGTRSLFHLSPLNAPVPHGLSLSSTDDGRSSLDVLSLSFECLVLVTPGPAYGERGSESHSVRGVCGMLRGTTALALCPGPLTHSPWPALMTLSLPLSFSRCLFISPKSVIPNSAVLLLFLFSPS